MSLPCATGVFSRKRDLDRADPIDFGGPAYRGLPAVTREMETARAHYGGRVGRDVRIHSAVQIGTLRQQGRGAKCEQSEVASQVGSSRGEASVKLIAP